MKNSISPFYIVVELISGMIVGSGSGYLIDLYIGSLPIFLFIFSIFGIAAGSYNVYNTLKLSK